MPVGESKRFEPAQPLSSELPKRLHHKDNSRSKMYKWDFNHEYLNISISISFSSTYCRIASTSAVACGSTRHNPETNSHNHKNGIGSLRIQPVRL